MHGDRRVYKSAQDPRNADDQNEQFEEIQASDQLEQSEQILWSDQLQQSEQIPAYDQFDQFERYDHSVLNFQDVALGVTNFGRTSAAGLT